MGCIPHHYNLGFTANGMSAWNIPNENVDEVGETLGKYDFVSHCYQRPRHKPIWPYNLFAMVHGRSKDEVHEKVNKLREEVSLDDVKSKVLFSTKLLKKQGVRLSK